MKSTDFVNLHMTCSSTAELIAVERKPRRRNLTEAKGLYRRKGNVVGLFGRASIDAGIGLRCVSRPALTGPAGVGE